MTDGQENHFGLRSLKIYSLEHNMSGFVCVEVLRPSQPNGVMLSAVSLPNHMFTGQAVLKAVNQYCAHSFARN